MAAYNDMLTVSRARGRGLDSGTSLRFLERGIGIFFHHFELLHERQFFGTEAGEKAVD
jgi:hypothetical protein